MLLGESLPTISAESCGRKGSVEVYDDTWSVVDQPHILPNNLGAVEIEGLAYTISLSTVFW